jgi:uncharacterized protein (TIGR00369 family)
MRGAITMAEFERDNFCFACGKDNPIGLGMRVQLFPEGAKSRVSISPEYQGWTDVVHGGIVTTLLDEIMAHAVHNHVGDAVTTTLTVTFRQALKVNQPVDVIGRVTQRKKRSVSAEAEIRAADNGKVIAKAQSQFILLSGLFSNNSSL